MTRAIRRSRTPARVTETARVDGTAGRWNEDQAPHLDIAKTSQGGGSVTSAPPGGPARRSGPWKDLGYDELANTVRRICTLCGWTQDPGDSGRVLAITSAVAAEGKSTLARAVAISTAQDHDAGVLLVECDLLTPTIAADFGVEAVPGLAEVLVDRSDVGAAVHATGLPNLWLLPAGGKRDNPSRLLRSSAMSFLLHEVRSRYGFIVLDLPAVLQSSDAAVLAQQCDGAILVIRAGTTDQRAVQRTLQLLSGTSLHGVVLNRWQAKTPSVVRRIVEL